MEILWWKYYWIDWIHSLHLLLMSPWFLKYIQFSQKCILNTNQRITYNIIILSTNLAMHPVRQPMIIKQFNRCIDQILHKFSKGRSGIFYLTRIKSFENVVILGSKFKLISVATNESFKGMSDEEKLCWALSICIECILGIQMIGHCIGPGSTNLKIGRKKKFIGEAKVNVLVKVLEFVGLEQIEKSYNDPKWYLNQTLQPRYWKTMKNKWSIEHILFCKRLDFQAKSQSQVWRTKR